MIQLKILFMTVLLWLSDPVTRKRAALQRAERKGMARMMDPLQRALADADALGIRFNDERLQEYLQVLKTISPTLASLSPMTPAGPTRVLPMPLPTSPLTGMPTYMVSSMTLAKAYAHLTQRVPNAGQEPEWMLAVTGVKQDSLRTLEHLLEVKLASQSEVTASFDMQDFARIAVTLDEQGMTLHAIFHSHRFAGPPQPSTVDWRLQKLLDQGGYPAIQAVFSEDGYVRFFANHPFSLTVSGKGVECVDKNGHLYRIVQFGTLPQLGDSPRPKDALRPLLAHPRR